MHICKYVHMYVYMYDVYVNVYVYVYVHVYVYVYVCVYVYVYVCVRFQTYILKAPILTTRHTGHSFVVNMIVSAQVWHTHRCPHGMKLLDFVASIQTQHSFSSTTTATVDRGAAFSC